MHRSHAGLWPLIACFSVLAVVNGNLYIEADGTIEAYNLGVATMLVLRPSASALHPSVRRQGPLPAASPVSNVDISNFRQPVAWASPVTKADTYYMSGIGTILLGQIRLRRWPGMSCDVVSRAWAVPNFGILSWPQDGRVVGFVPSIRTCVRWCFSEQAAVT